jgi:hypothetical protein
MALVVLNAHGFVKCLLLHPLYCSSNRNAQFATGTQMAHGSDRPNQLARARNAEPHAYPHTAEPHTGVMSLPGATALRTPPRPYTEPWGGPITAIVGWTIDRSWPDSNSPTHMAVLFYFMFAYFLDAFRPAYVSTGHPRYRKDRRSIGI